MTIRDAVKGRRSIDAERDASTATEKTWTDNVNNITVVSTYYSSERFGYPLLLLSRIRVEMPRSLLLLPTADSGIYRICDA
jgi:hypothetical protein